MSSSPTTPSRSIVGIVAAVVALAVVGSFGSSVANALGFAQAQDPTTTQPPTTTVAPTTAPPTTVPPTEPPPTDPPTTTAPPTTAAPTTAAPTTSPPTTAPSPAPTTAAPTTTAPPTTVDGDPAPDPEAEAGPAETDTDERDVLAESGVTVEGVLDDDGDPTTEPLDATVASTGGGLSQEARVNLIIGALLAVAAVAAALTFLYWRHTRPGRVDVAADAPTAARVEDSDEVDDATAVTGEHEAVTGEHPAAASGDTEDWDEAAGWDDGNRGHDVEDRDDAEHLPSRAEASMGSATDTDTGDRAESLPARSRPSEPPGDHRLGTSVLPIVTLEDLEREATAGGSSEDHDPDDDGPAAR
ncbi:MAG: hypothetical protein JJU45_12265 [Acidimicrobiia bacterium]|nr:hypothetical protein [Acidimicrobiia bacterium]